MTGLLALIGLVVAAFLVAAAARGKSGYGIVSGAEFLIAGAIIGPEALALVDREMLESVRPGVTLAVGFLGMLFGMRLRAERLRRLGASGVTAILCESGGTLAAVAFGLPALAALLPGQVIAPVEAWALAIVAAPSTKSVFAWARARLSAKGPVIDWLESLTRHDDLVSVVALAALVSILPPPSLAAPLAAHPGAAALACVALGVVTGGAFTLLGGRRPDRDTAWVLLTGLTLLSGGVATRLGLPTIVVGLVLGLVIASTTAELRLLDEIDQQTEQPVVLLLLMLVGTRLTLAGSWPLILAVVALRLLTKLGSGLVVGPLRAGGPGAGAGLFGFGGMALAIAAQLDLLYGAAVGPILSLAAALALSGDVLGALGLRALLQRVGEIGQEEAP